MDAGQAGAADLVLGLETGGDHLSIALLSVAHDGVETLLEARTAFRGPRHADTLLTHADAMLRAHGKRTHDLTLVAVGRGPGGFTGVRVGLATALGLHLGTGVPVWPVCSLASLAFGTTGSDLREVRRVAVMIDARRGEVYGGLFSLGPGAGPEPMFPPEAGPREAFERKVLALTGGAEVTWVGSGVPHDGTDAGNPAHIGSAVSHARLAARCWREAGRDPSQVPPLDPAYLRRSEAELNAEKALEKRRAMGE